MSDSVASKVVEIIARQAVLKVSDIDLEASLADIGIDSLGMVEAVFAIEEAFDITVPFNANDPDANTFDIRTVRSTIEAVKGLLASKTS